MLEKIKEQKKEIGIIILITILFFGSFIKPDYVTDTYSIWGNPWKDSFIHFLSLGRFVTAFFWAIIRICNIKFVISYEISYFIAIYAIILSIYKMYNILLNDIKNKILCLLISITVIINPFSLELFMYFEKGILALSVLLNILAVEELIKVFNGEKQKIVKVILYMLLANFSYQGVVATFVAISSVYILKYSSNIKQFIKNNIITIICYAIPAVVNYMVVKLIYNSDRVKDIGNLAQTIKDILISVKRISIETCGILPKYFYLTCIGIISIIIIKYTIKEKDKIGILKYMYVIFAILFASLMPQIMQSNVYVVPRNVYAFASTLGIAIIFLKLNYNITLKEEKIFKVVIFILLIVQYVNFNNIIITHYNTNQLDEYIANKIVETINEYEQTTGNTITKIVYYKDKSNSWKYENVQDLGDANIKAFSATWGTQGIINMKLNRVLDITENDQTYEEYFKSKDWTSFDKEQIKFNKETMYLCVF